MAAGVRIRHLDPRAANRTLVASDMSRPFRAPYACPHCATMHACKTLHLTLDEVGATIVSAGVLDELRRIPGMGGFIIENEVAEPPPIKLVIPPQRMRLAAPAPGSLPPIVSQESM